MEQINKPILKSPIYIYIYIYIYMYVLHLAGCMFQDAYCVINANTLNTSISFHKKLDLCLAHDVCLASTTLVYES